MQAIAKLRNCPTSDRKMRLVADVIRGERVENAINILRFSKKHAASDIERLLISCISNWEQANEGSRAEDSNLFVKEIKVDQGKSIKRFRPAPFGRPHRIRKRSNHVTIVLDSLDAKAESES